MPGDVTDDVAAGTTAAGTWAAGTRAGSLKAPMPELRAGNLGVRIAAAPEEVDAAIAAAVAQTGAASAKDMGKVMKAANVILAGKRVDGKVLSERVRAKLG